METLSEAQLKIAATEIRALRKRITELETLLGAAVDLLKEAVEREYNAFEPENQSEQYHKLRAFLSFLEGK